MSAYKTWPLVARHYIWHRPRYRLGKSTTIAFIRLLLLEHENLQALLV